jgi:hypothetical protein
MILNVYQSNFNTKLFKMKKYLLSLGLLTVFFSYHSNAQCIKGNCYNGTGTFKFENGDVYDGAWRQGKIHGTSGKYEFANGDKYEGAYIDGKRHGVGKYTWSRGGSYTGSWEEDRRNGFGSYQWPNSSTYRGYWKDDQLIDLEVLPGEATQEQPLLK